MGTVDDITTSTEAVTHPLLIDLTPEQVALLRVIAWPLRSGRATDDQGWPVWDGVRRRFEHDQPEIDIEQVLSSLPRLPPSQYWPTGYGLWWRFDAKRSPFTPVADEQVGLTIAGLLALARHEGEPALAADLIVGLVREAAGKEAAVSIEEMWSVVDERLDGRQVLGSTDAGGQIRLTGAAADGEPVEVTVSVSVIGRVLCREYLPLAINLAPRDFQIPYGQGHLRPFRQVQDAEDYLDRIAVLAHRDAITPTHRAPLPLPETLDFLAYVLHAEPTWKTHDGKLLTAGQGLISPISGLRTPATTQAEFLDRVSALWTVLGALNVPTPTDADLHKHGWKDKRPLNSLQIWLENRFGQELYADLIAEEFKIIRAAQKTRNYGAHPSGSTAIDVKNALTRFGLPFPILDWPTAWETILGRLADAFDSIRVSLISLGASPDSSS